MTKYALLVNPGHSRVYHNQLCTLAAAELELLFPRLSAACADTAWETVAGVRYITFRAEPALGPEDVLLVSRLSFIYALFLFRGTAEEPVFLPAALAGYEYMDSGVGSILKYTGKTNELFTRMLIHIAELTSDFGPAGRLRVFDPVAGKGTTLFEGLVRGHDVYGVEIGERAVAEACTYFRKYLETEKYKHTVKTDRVCGEKRSFAAARTRFEIAKTKEEQKSGAPRILEFVAGDSSHTGAIFRKNFFHLIVGDLPYGVQHGNVTAEKQSSITRNPKELLRACLGGWREALMPGGALVLAFNSFVLPRREMAELLESHGFRVKNDGPYLRLEHRVDQAIRRDVIAAVK